jgi:hypothetical protein
MVAIVITVVVMSIMIVVVPVAVGVPAMGVFIPPTVETAPAKLAGLMQLGAGAVGLRATPAVTFHRLVEPMIGAGDALLAVMFAGHGAGASGKKQKSGKRDRSHDR